MGNGYRVPADDGVDELSRILNRQNARVSESERPTGTQVFEALAKVRQLIDDIGTYVDAYLTSGFTTGSMTASGSITVGGNANVTGTVTGTAGINSLGAYNNNLTGVGGFRVAYWGVNGAAGYVPSSLRFKQDIEPAEIDTEALLEVQPVRYRYRDAVANFGDDAPFDVGVIAEHVDGLGLDWLIDYEADESGQMRPLGFKYDRLPIALLAVVKQQSAQIRELTERLDAQAQTGTP